MLSAHAHFNNKIPCLYLQAATGANEGDVSQ
jgi:hypothetical protein